MKNQKLIHNNRLSKLWIFKVALLCSIFSFNGYNGDLQFSFLKTHQTELFESKANKTKESYKISVDFTSKEDQIKLSKKTNYQYALINHTNSITIKYRTVLKTNSYRLFVSKKFTSKTLALYGEDEPPVFSLL